VAIFRRTLSDPNVEASHAVMYIAKAAGKLAGACDDEGHGRETCWMTWIAEGFGEAVLRQEIERRIAEKNA
jgi:hypothetical protein